MKKSILTLVALIAFLGSSFANIDPEKDSADVENAKPNRELTADEIQLQQQLDAELEVTLEDLLELTHETAIDHVIVYDRSGKMLLEQNDAIDLDQLPEGADLLMTDGSTRYYLVD